MYEQGLMVQAGCESEVKQAQPVDMLKRLQQKKIRCESDLADINNAIEALSANPEIERVLTLLAKANGRY